VKAAIDYADRTGGKPVTPIEQTLTVTHKSAEESASKLLELISDREKETKQAQQPIKATTIQ
jgi:hypothetical protein